MTREQELGSEAARSARDPRTRIIILILSLLAAGSLITAVIAGWFALNDANENARAGQSLANDVRVACANPVLKKDLEDSRPGICGQAKDVTQQVIQGEQGEQGDPGVPGEQGPPPSDAQVADAVARYCTGKRCDGTDGSDGVDGDDATPAQVASAVARYCNARGECEGDAGPQGPPPSSDQVLTAVQTYCSTRNQCRGTKGDTGPTGPTGPAGTSVLNGSATCRPNGVGTDDDVLHFEFTRSNDAVPIRFNVRMPCSSGL